ncbi:MAG: PH domain-containing protein [Actinomycetia bacterium]|nr:PH domain-containing protein [Actinomycetes bacterium]
MTVPPHPDPAGFANPILDVDHLPRLDPTDFQPVDRRQLQLELALLAVSTAVVGLGLAGVLLVGGSALGALVVVAAATAIGASGAGLIRAAHRRRGWLVRDHDLSIRRGIVRRRVTTVPFNRVQHAAVNTGPLDRHFGLARLEVYTAGGQKADLSLEGLPHDRAQQLRELVTERAQATER